MADTTVAVTPGAGAPIRVLSGLGAGSGDQQVITLADSAGNLLGTTGAGLPVEVVGTGGLTPVTGAITAAVANTPGSAVTASTTAQVVIAIPTAGNVTFHLVASAFVGTVVFEASVDGGLNYATLPCVREDGAGTDTALVLNTAAYFIRQYTAALPGFLYFRVRCSIFTSGSLAVILQPGPSLVETQPSLSAGSSNIGSVAPQVTATGVITSVALAASSFTILSANALRKGATFFNDSVNTLYLGLISSAVSATTYTVQIPPGGYFELPNQGYLYTGQVNGFSAVASGSVRVTELT